MLVVVLLFVDESFEDADFLGARAGRIPPVVGLLVRRTQAGASSDSAEPLLLLLLV
jgi:hypothetical protein